MKKLLHIVLLLFMVSAVYSQSNRFREEVFSAVKRTENIVYGVNATALGLFTPYNEALPQPLVLDLYEPEGDIEEARPLIIFSIPEILFLSLTIQALWVHLGIVL